MARNHYGRDYVRSLPFSKIFVAAGAASANEIRRKLLSASIDLTKADTTKVFGKSETWVTISRMRAHFEKVTFGGASFLIFERVDQGFPMSWHYHPEFQLTLMVDGQGQRLVGDGVAEYGPGDLFLLGPNLPHAWRTGTRRSAARHHHAVDVQFRSDFFGKDFFNKEEMKPIVRLLKRSASGLSFGHTKTGSLVAPKIAEFPYLSPPRRVLSILNVLMDLALESDARVLSTDWTDPICRVEDQRRIEAVCAYLKEHYDEEIELASVAHKFHTDQASLCRFFKRATGSTMTAYINGIRVGAAAQMLTETNRSILEIAFSVGFGNYSNFSRQFKRFKGHGPRVLRQQFLSNSPPAKPRLHPTRVFGAAPALPLRTHS
jgi:AraC-like DNA-binding protein/quercetin dioxygenase-like cupin family protein